MFKRWVIHIIVNMIVLMVIAGYLKAFYIQDVWAALGASILISILNIFVKPVLIFLTLPVTVLTMGLFLIVINAIILGLTAALMGDSFEIGGFGTAILAAILMAVLNLLIQNLIIKPLSR